MKILINTNLIISQNKYYLWRSLLRFVYKRDSNFKLSLNIESRKLIKLNWNELLNGYNKKEAHQQENLAREDKNEGKEEEREG